MNDLIGRVLDFKDRVFSAQSDLYARLAADGQSPKALMISCADSRVVPEHIMQAQPGDLFVCRNAGNIVPPFATMNGGVSSTVEYAVVVLGVRDIIVCGHSDCGAMKALGKEDVLKHVPNVAAWLRHSQAAHKVACDCYPTLEGPEFERAVAMENVVAQIAHLRTHPSVATAIAQGKLALHGWFFDIHAGSVQALNGETGRFQQVREGEPMPVALAPAVRRAAALDNELMVAAQ